MFTKGVFTHSDAVTHHHCVIGDGLSDGQNGF